MCIIKNLLRLLQIFSIEIEKGRDPLTSYQAFKKRQNLTTKMAFKRSGVRSPSAPLCGGFRWGSLTGTKDRTRPFVLGLYGNCIVGCLPSEQSGHFELKSQEILSAKFSLAKCPLFYELAFFLGIQA